MKQTQTDVARKCEISQPSLSNILSGRRRPSVHVAARLEAATGKHRLYWLYPGEYDKCGNPVASEAPAPEPSS